MRTLLGELATLIEALNGAESIAVVGPGLELAQIARSLDAATDAEVTTNVEPGAKLLQLEAASESREGREAHRFGSCDPLRAALGKGQERGLARLEAFLNEMDEQVAQAWSLPLAQEVEVLQVERRIVE